MNKYTDQTKPGTRTTLKAPVIGAGLGILAFATTTAALYTHAPDATQTTPPMAIANTPKPVLPAQGLAATAMSTQTEGSAAYMARKLEQLKQQQSQSQAALKQLQQAKPLEQPNFSDPNSASEESPQPDLTDQHLMETAELATSKHPPLLPIGHKLAPEVRQAVDTMTHRSTAGTQIEHFADGTSMVDMGSTAFRAVPVATIGKDGSIHITEL